MFIIGFEVCMFNLVYIEDIFFDCFVICSIYFGKLNSLRGFEVNFVLYLFSVNYVRVDF